MPHQYQYHSVTSQIELSQDFMEKNKEKAKLNNRIEFGS